MHGFARLAHQALNMLRLNKIVLWLIKRLISYSWIRAHSLSPGGEMYIYNIIIYMVSVSLTICLDMAVLNEKKDFSFKMVLN